MSRSTFEHWFPPGDYTDRLNVAFEAYQRALKDSESDRAEPQLLTEEDPVDILRREYEELRDEAKTAALESRRYVRGQAISRGDKKKLREKHPPRTEGADEDTLRADRLAGMNLDTAGDDLVFASLVEPVFSSRADFDDWADNVLTDGEFEVLLQESWSRANVAQYDPKSLPA